MPTFGPLEFPKVFVSYRGAYPYYSSINRGWVDDSININYSISISILKSSYCNLHMYMTLYLFMLYCTYCILFTFLNLTNLLLFLMSFMTTQDIIGLNWNVYPYLLPPYIHTYIHITHIHYTNT
jgi:hypothetical protein